MTFAERLAKLGFQSYSDYLQSPHWLKFRRKYKKRSQRMTCAVCDATPIQLHHTTYERLGREKLTDVKPLCDLHHKAVHAWLKERHLTVEHTAGAISALRPPKPPKIKLPKPPKQQRQRPPRQASSRSPAVDHAKSEANFAELQSLPCTPRQLRAAEQFMKKGRHREIAELARQARHAKHKPKEFLRPEPKPNSIAAERLRWTDPLYAIRMLGNGRQPIQPASR